jgi:predicted nucleic acid-binding protein
VYFDTSYVAKFYLQEPESKQVRELVFSADVATASFWGFVEFHAVLHRRLREGSLSPGEVRRAKERFESNIEQGLWNLVPVTEVLLRRTAARVASAPAGLLLRAGDAVHLMTAMEAGELEIWTSDRHMLAAAAYFGLTGRSV